jgi:glycosyltransferase involved in cell wall biosynthesis
MRIVHVITRLIVGGAQENTILCCQDLIRDFGDEVLLVTGPALGPEGSLAEDALKRNIPMVTIGALRRNINPWRDAGSYHQIKRVLRDFNPEVVHTHSAKAGVLGRFAAAHLGVPAIVHTVHGAPFHAYQNAISRRFFQLIEKQAARRCHQFVSVADAMTDIMVNARIAHREKFITFYSGMDVDLFLNSDSTRKKVRRQLGYDSDQIVVGKVARLFDLKGHSDVIRAARAIVDRQPKVQFLFVGDGILKDSLRSEISRNNLDKHFQFTGLVTPQRVAELMGAMDLVVHASLREGLARALPQALIAGKPVVSYDVDGAREVVVQGVTGYLVPPCDVVQLGEAIGTLVGDQESRRRMGQEGSRQLRGLFSHQAMTESLRKLYQSLLRGPSPPG